MFFQVARFFFILLSIFISHSHLNGNDKPHSVDNRVNKPLKQKVLESCRRLQAWLWQHSPPHVRGSRGEDSFRTPQTKATIKNNTVINDIQYSYPREVLFNFFDNFTVAEIEKFVFDEKFRSEILRKTDRDPMLLRSTAAILLSRRATPNLVPGIPLTPDQFNYQASLLGVSPQTFPVLYRLDSRAPTKIKKEGFVPNPKKEPFTMWESVLPGLQGGGNFVSTSYASTIDKALSSKPSEIGFLSGFSKINQERVYAKINKKLLSGSRTLLIERTEQSMGAIKGDSKVIFLKTYQFKIENQIGVGVPDEVGISVEKEVLSRIIPPENVSQFRSVEILAVTRPEEHRANNLSSKFNYFLYPDSWQDLKP